MESTIFSVKHLYDFGDVRRRGIDEVTAELLEKVVVFNFARIGKIEKAKQAKIENRKKKAS